jgi:hypothetical protein
MIIREFRGKMLERDGGGRSGLGPGLGSAFAWTGCHDGGSSFFYLNWQMPERPISLIRGDLKGRTTQKAKISRHFLHWIVRNG